MVGPQSDLRSGIAKLPLATQGEHKYRVDFRDVAIQGDEAARAASDHQLSLVGMNGAPDKGILPEYGDRLNDFPDARGRIGGLVVDKVIENAIEVISDFRGQFDARHPQRANLRATGRFTGLPARRPSR